ncbi:glycosyltransferase family 25 protein [Limoniibacter endophyticus]|uniref:Glycosyl transferase family 25 domain-containing protein n=1 Tax=Limoniibacter endophyticus TaxID=1565040 RepID=A0A8J3DG06_9HYPH|nr:glycosyltransferase family 25 protein [Limoniibacter endophyticus]GHC65862.1 hypothetical protein GCM10010136_08890 [Limoniibacter endophyticus]
MERVEAFVIHLKRATRRASQVEKLKLQSPVLLHVLDAVDAQTMPEELVRQHFQDHLFSPNYPFVLQNTEIACFLSHRRAWQAIIDNDLEAGLVIEDDVDLHPQFAEAFEKAVSILKPSDYIRFPRYGRGEEPVRHLLRGDISIFAPRLPGLGMQATLIGRQAAHALLDATEKFDRPVDTMIQMHWIHGARVLTVRPICISEVHQQLGGTVVQKKRQPLLYRLNHEIGRPFYRLQIWLMSKMRRAAARG